MTRRNKWIGVIAAIVIAVGAVFWVSARLSTCVYRQSDPAYSPDGRFYSQMEFTICRDHARSHVRLVMGTAGKSDKTVLIEMLPEIGTVDVAWRDGSELHVRVAKSAISKLYGPFDNLPHVVVTEP